MFVRYRLLLASEQEEGDITGCVFWHFPSSLWESQQQRLCDASVEMLQLMKRELSAALCVVAFFCWTYIRSVCHVNVLLEGSLGAGEPGGERG